MESAPQEAHEKGRAESPIDHRTAFFICPTRRIDPCFSFENVSGSAFFASEQEVGLTVDRMIEDIRVRLGGKGLLDPLPITSVSNLEARSEGLPDWWQANGNILYCAADTLLPQIRIHPGLPPPTNARVVLGCVDMPGELLLWGDGPAVILGANTRFPAAGFSCGGDSIIVVGSNTFSSLSARVDCRNGGAVLVGDGGLWAEAVQINSDDMHAVRDLRGNRINAFGGVVVIAPSVWLAFQVLVLSGARIGRETVVGARSVVTGKLPSNSVCVGVPAKAVKSGTRWESADLP